MKVQQVIDYFGGTRYKAAKALGYSTNAAYTWARKGYIPYDTQSHIERVTGGALRANIKHAKPQDLDTGDVEIVPRVTKTKKEKKISKKSVERCVYENLSKDELIKLVIRYESIIQDLNNMIASKNV